MLCNLSLSKSPEEDLALSILYAWSKINLPQFTEKIESPPQKKAETAYTSAVSLNTGIRCADKTCTSYTVRIQCSIAAPDKANDRPWQVVEGRFLHKSPKLCHWLSAEQQRLLQSFWNWIVRNFAKGFREGRDAFIEMAYLCKTFSSTPYWKRLIL